VEPGILAQTHWDSLTISTGVRLSSMKILLGISFLPLVATKAPLLSQPFIASAQLEHFNLTCVILVVKDWLVEHGDLTTRRKPGFKCGWLSRSFSEKQLTHS